tara:strand:- start:348 stop:695 length:348 start_codon:yes stop_codon:yes gene_type:complete
VEINIIISLASQKKECVTVALNMMIFSAMKMKRSTVKMTKKQILKILRDYKEEEQIFCIWWDKDCFEHLDMTDEEWVKVVYGLDDYSFEDMTGNMLDAVEQELSEIKEESKNEKV